MRGTLKMNHYNFNKSLANKQRGLKREDETNWKNKDQEKSFCANKLIDFCKRTDLHGYKYIVMEDLNIVERCCWAIAVILSIAIAGYFVITAYRWYARNPIVTVIESTQGAIWDVPFPAITICDLNMISKKAAENFVKNLSLPTNISREFVLKSIRSAPLLHSTYIANDIQKQDLLKLQTVLDNNNVSIETFFRELSPVKSCSNLIERCMWKNTVYRCEQLFQHVVTVLGFCCAFNYYGIDSDGGTTQLKSPRRVASCGYQTALTVILNTNVDDYFSASVASRGSLVFVDEAYNVPDLDSPVRMVNPSTEVLISLSPELTYTVPGIKTFSPEQRQCYYNDEIQISNFRQYSFHNCIAFLKMDTLKENCECVPFYHPTKDYHRTCNFNDVNCLEKSLKSNRQYPSYFTYNGEIKQCLPECDHYDYPLEVALGNLAKNVQLNGLPFFNDVNLENRSLLNVFFNDLVSTRYRRDIYLNWQNVLAAFGGLLSLMLGFTLVSGFDFLLFFTFKMAYDSVKNVKNESQVNSMQGRVYKDNIINVQERHQKRGNMKKDTLAGLEFQKRNLKVYYNTKY